MATPSAQTLIELEHRFWQSMVDQDAESAVQMLSEPALMVSAHGAMKFDHAQYRQMAEQGSMTVESFELSDVQVVFPQPMLEIGLHPSADIETQLIFAYNRWFTSRILAHEPRIKSMLALLFASPDACLRTIEEFAGRPGG